MSQNKEERLTKEELAAVAAGEKVKIEQELYEEEGALPAFSAGAARGATLGLSDQLIDDPETLSKLQEFQPGASIGGEITGTLAGSLLPVAPAGIAAKAGVVTTEALAKVLGKEGSKQFLKRIAAQGAGSAVEGAAIGTGQLLSEEALGRADFNAESMAAFAGLGALVGGAAGSLNPIAGELVKGSTKVGKQIASKLEFADGPSAVASLLKLSKSRASKLSKEGVLDDILGILQKDKIPVTADVAEDMGDILLKNLDDSYNTFSQNVKKADDIFNATFSSEEKARIIQNLDLDSVSRQVKKALPDEELISFTASTARRAGDPLARLRESVSPGYTDILSGLSATRGKLQQRLLESGRTVAPEVKKALETVNNRISRVIRRISKDESVAAELNPLIQANRNISSINRVLPDVEARKFAASSGFTELAAGALATAGASITGSPEGGLFAVPFLLKRALRSDIASIAKIRYLANIEKNAAATKTAIKKAAENIVKGTKIPLKAAPALKQSATREVIKILAPDAKEGKSNFATLKEPIEEIRTNPEKLVDISSRATIGLRDIAPNIAAEMSNASARGLSFLADKFPVNPAAERTSNPYIRKWEPSKTQMDKFERFAKAVMDPMSVIENFSINKLDREGVQAIAQIYPALYEQLLSEVTEQLGDKAGELPYTKRVELGILFNTPFEYSQDPQVMISLQSTFAPPQTAGGQPAQPSAADIKASDDVSSDSRTETERVARRGFE